MIPVIDIFAGPGGLGEGFSVFRRKKDKIFNVVLSIEKDKTARETLRLRSFLRQFPDGAPDEYYGFVRAEETMEGLYQRYPKEARTADEQAWLAELGNPEKFPSAKIDKRIERALAGAEDWVLIGGPPCQAYSLAGRSRMAREPEKHEKDHRHFLYREYLRIIAKHRPPVFVMENVKGILSSRVEGNLIINRIIEDLKRPCDPNEGDTRSAKTSVLTYRLYPFASYGENRPPVHAAGPSQYIIRAERHGIPQARHRLIILGVRGDMNATPSLLRNREKDIAVWKAISSLPQLRSKLSRTEDSAEAWKDAVRRVLDPDMLGGDGIDLEVWRTIKKATRKIQNSLETGGEFVRSGSKPAWQMPWFHDSRLGGACNHSSRSHIEGDLWRYFFAACFARVHGRSPLLTDFPDRLLPRHKNAITSDEDDGFDFADRFRVQVKGRPSTTVTAHIAKDGHYFIHPDPLQCRSLTVREAARIQTFPDNYFFVGPRTEQYKQVGNAVPPLLARQLAKVVYGLLESSSGARHKADGHAI